MGAVSDWVNMGDTGRMRAWLLAMAVALIGVLGMEAANVISFSSGTFPPYRTENFAWLRYLLGGLMFGIGMTLGSGCGSKTLIRVGGGNLKSVVVLVIAALMAYLMMWTSFFETAFMSWIGPTSVSLAKFGIPSQELSAVVAGVTGTEASPTFRLIIGAWRRCGHHEIYVLAHAERSLSPVGWARFCPRKGEADGFPTAAPLPVRSAYAFRCRVGRRQPCLPTLPDYTTEKK